MPRLWQILRKKASGSSNPNNAEPYKPERRVMNSPMGQTDDSGRLPLKHSDSPYQLDALPT